MTVQEPSTNSAPTGTLAGGETKPPVIAPSLRLRESLRELAPAICLVATLGAAGLVYWTGGAGAGQVVGFAQTTSQAVASIETGRVNAILVNVGDPVVAGQVVATLDTAALDAEIAVAEAQQAQIEAEMRAEEALVAQRLDQEVEGLERERARHREEQLRVRAEAKVLDSEVTRVKRMIAERQAVADDLSQLGLRQAGATALAEAKPRTIGLLGKQIELAEKRRNSDRSALSQKLAARLLVAERSIELLRRRREGYSLRAEQAGRVSLIAKRPGDVVPSGTAVLQIVRAEPRVITCIPEKVALAVREGDVATLRIRGQSSAPLRGKAVALSPLVAELPARCWVSPRVPVWGREVTVLLDEPVELLPGQAFEVSFETSHVIAGPTATAAVTAATATAAASAAAASPMAVPRELSLRTRLEPSGVLQQGPEARYLIVSDDTGRDGDEGEPWLFSMSATGVIDPEPVVLSGAREVNDLEAITASPAGEIYLLSSQSFSKKGRRKPARTALWRLRPEGKGFQVTGEAHLAEQLDLDPELSSALGLAGGTAALDIEGMALKDGMLFLGLKAPLDARGRAMIWRIASPAALFDAPSGSKEAGSQGPDSGKGLKNAGLTLWATARVDVEVAGQSTPGGISDLLFLPGGTLAITSTPSTAEGDAGSLWRVDNADSGELAPRLIARFPGRKAEGISPSLAPGKLMVVFDTGNAAPLFQEVLWAP